MTCYPEENICHISRQAGPGGDEDDLGGGPGYHHQSRVRRRLPAVLGALLKVLSDWQYPCRKIREITFLCISNSFRVILSVTFDFEYVSSGTQLKKKDL